jgi:hypothetical protein
MIGFQCNRHIFTKIVTNVRVLGKLQKVLSLISKTYYFPCLSPYYLRTAARVGYSGLNSIKKKQICT